MCEEHIKEKHNKQTVDIFVNWRTFDGGDVGEKEEAGGGDYER